MLKRLLTVVFGLLLFGSDSASAQGGPPSHADGTMFQKLEGYGGLGVSHDVVQHDDDLFGHSIDTETGTLSFRVTDVSLPGNSDLEVAFGRNAPSGEYSAMAHNFLGSTWQMDIPHIIFSVDAGTLGNTSRCTGAPSSGAPKPSGVNLFTPSEGRRHVGISSGLTSPAGSPVTKISKDYWLFHCGLNVQGGGGEGFWVTAPNGDLYKFDRMFKRPGQTLVLNGGATLIGQENLIFYPSEIRDVNGNWVRYEYNTVGPTRIYANDGRQIDIGYDAPGTSIRTVTANGRTWSYSANANRVTLPDGRYWDYILSPMYYHQGFSCSTARTGLSNGTVSIRHPDGVTATYKLRAVRNLLLGAPDGVGYETREAGVNRCTGPGFPFPKWTYSLGVTERKHTLPNGEDRIWRYDYEQDPSEHKLPFSNSAFGLRIFVPYNAAYDRPIRRTMTDPEGNVTVTHINRRLDEFKGTIAKIERFDAANLSAPLETSEFEYVQNLSHVFPSYSSGPILPIPFTTTKLPTKVTVTRGADQYLTENAYDTGLGSATFGYGQPHTVRQSSNVASGVRESVTTFSNLRERWILALPTRQILNGKVFTDLAYDSKGRVVSSDRFGSRWATFAYHEVGDQAGRVASATDALNRTTSFASYKRGQPQSVTRADGSTIGRVVDDNGWVTSETNARGIITGYAYDNMARLTLIDKPAGWDDTTIAYTGLGSGIVKTLSSGTQQVTTTYNGMYEPVRERARALAGGGGSIWKTFDFDKLGRPVFESQPSTSSLVTAGVTTSYDALGRMTQTRENVAPFATITYAYLSQNRTRVTDPSGAQTTTAYQAYGAPATEEVKSITDPLGTVMTYSYNIFGQVLSINQAGTQNGVSSNVTRQFWYDDRLRVCRHRAPEFGDELMAYDAKDRLTFSSRGEAADTSCAAPTSSRRTAFTYDALDRQTLFDFPGTTPDITKTYDPNGNVTSVSRSTTRWDYGYNNADMLTNETLTIDGRTYAMDHGYNTSGFLSSTALPAGGGTINFDPDGLGRIKSIRNGGIRYVGNIVYHATNAPSSAAYGNGTSFSQSLDGRQLPYDLIVSGSGSGTQMHLRHVYDARGKISSITDYVVQGQNRNFTYDARGRVTAANGPWGAGSYVYDALDNIRTKTLGSRTVNLAYDGSNRVSQVADSVNGSRSWAYDTLGNVTNNGPNAFTYDWSNQPTGVSAPGLSETHVYDGNLKRAKTVRNGKTTYWIYSSLTGGLVYADEVTDNVKTHYLTGGGVSIRLKNGVAEYTHLNHQGSAELATDAAGGVLWREHYTPFGEKLANPTANRDDAGYTGHIQDDLSGLTYMQARYYDPIAGRFLSTDPIGYADQMNLYAYVGNDPVNAVDPKGLECSHSYRAEARTTIAVCIVNVSPDPETGRVSAKDYAEAERIAEAQAVSYLKAVFAAKLGKSERVGSVGKFAGFDISAESIATVLRTRRTVFHPGIKVVSDSGTEALMRNQCCGLFGQIDVFDGVRDYTSSGISRAFFHEAIHTSSEEGAAGSSDHLGISPYDKLHQDPYNAAASRMYQNWGKGVVR